MSTSSTLSLILLSESDKLRGYENYAAWKTLMEVHGKPKGLHKYWENLVKIPAGYESDTDDDEKEKEDKSKETTPTGETHTAASGTTSTKETSAAGVTTPAATDKPTPLHSVTPTPLKYELWKGGPPCGRLLSTGRRKGRTISSLVERETHCSKRECGNVINVIWVYLHWNTLGIICNCQF